MPAVTATSLNYFLSSFGLSNSNRRTKKERRPRRQTGAVPFVLEIRARATCDAMASSYCGLIHSLMILMILPIIRVSISLVGLFAGYLCVSGLFFGKMRSGWTATFQTATVATSVVGTFFPQNQIIPAYVVILVSFSGLAVTIYARYSKLHDPWRDHVSVVAACSLYLNMFVGVVTAFQAIPYLKSAALAPSDPFFGLFQVSIMVLFLLLGWRVGLFSRPTIFLPSADRTSRPWIFPIAKKRVASP